MADVLAFVEQRDGQVGGTGREAVAVAKGIADSLGVSADAFKLNAGGLQLR